MLLSNVFARASVPSNFDEMVDGDDWKSKEDYNNEGIAQIASKIIKFHNKNGVLQVWPLKNRRCLF